MAHLSIQEIIIHNRIRDYRRELDVTQEQLASAVGVSRQSIISVETGRCLPSVSLALAISRFFSSNLEQLFPIELLHQPNEEEVMQNNISPLHSTANLHEAIDRMFDQTLSPTHQIDGSIMPKLDIYQTESELIVEADVPGMTEDTVEIEIQDGILTIKGERGQEKEDKQKEYFHREVSYGSFQRALTLPVECLPEKATATVKNGHLKVVLPKRELERPTVHKVKAKGDKGSS